VVKRLFDMSAAAVGLLFTLPILLIAAAAIRRVMGAPVVFRQVRPGLHGRPFAVCKFRTMTDARDAAGNPLPDADRLTPLGRFLRASSIDELPQLWNVLVGDMSLVGPRPLLMEYWDLYTPEQRRRHEVRPGITGWAQIHGRNTLDWQEKFRRDVWYVDNRSLALDLKILALTLLKVIRREGISDKGHATMAKFTGSSAIS